MLERRDLPRNVGVATGGRHDEADRRPAGEHAIGFVDRVLGG